MTSRAGPAPSSPIASDGGGAFPSWKSLPTAGPVTAGCRIDPPSYREETPEDVRAPLPGGDQA